MQYYVLIFVDHLFNGYISKNCFQRFTKKQFFARIYPIRQQTPMNYFKEKESYDQFFFQLRFIEAFINFLRYEKANQKSLRTKLCYDIPQIT